MGERLVSANELAKYLACSRQMINYLTKQGVIAKAKHPDGSEIKGRYDLRVCIGAYILRLRARAAIAASGDQDTEERWQEARISRMETQARRDQLRLEREEGRLVDPDDVGVIWEEYIGTCKKKLLALPIRCTNEIVIKQRDQAETYGILTERVREALLELVDYSEHYYAKHSRAG
jgi:phage terminase Nu1 subunit (DNA packaging protein)